MPQYAGGPGDDVVTGGNDNDELYGFAGNDRLYGLAGNDYLEGGPGADLMYGGSWDDNYVVDNADDQAIEEPDQGLDTVFSSISFGLGPNLENLQLTGIGNINGTGNALNNFLSGTSGSNVLDGGEGNDTMVGGAGDDVYIVDSSGDIVGEFADEGNDTILSSTSFALLGGGVETLILTGSSAIDATGDDSANNLQGNAGDNILSGRGGNDVLTGGPGYDTFLDKSYDLTGDTIADFTRGDRIVLSDAILAGFIYRVEGNILYFPGGSLSLGTLHYPSIAASAAPEGGVQFTFSGPPIIISAGASVSIAGAANAALQSASVVQVKAAETADSRIEYPSVNHASADILNTAHLVSSDLLAFV